MSRFDKPVVGSSVDWSDPQLQSLLDKTEGWSLDNRGVFSPVPCELHVGWGAGTGRPATLVFERGKVMVLEADFVIPRDEHVRVDHVKGGMPRSTWGVVVDRRTGHRADDHARGIEVYWVHAR